MYLGPVGDGEGVDGSGGDGGGCCSCPDCSQIEPVSHAFAAAQKEGNY